MSDPVKMLEQAIREDAAERTMLSTTQRYAAQWEDERRLNVMVVNEVGEVVAFCAEWVWAARGAP